MVNEIVSSEPFIDSRGKTYCRGCSGEKLFSALDLGELPIANELLLTPESTSEKFPLHLRICGDCGLGQVGDVVTPERIFLDYRYLSSMSTTFLKHASDFVTQFAQNNTFSRADWVLEIASNDGYLLKNFVALGVDSVGVEPAENVAELSKKYGINVINEFFSSKLAGELLNKFGYPKLIVANNVLAHVPDLIDFVSGISILCGPQTQISIENPSLVNILAEMQFDTIYHEHYSYLSATSVQKIAKISGLDLVRVENLMVHGGSNRYWLRSVSSGIQADETVHSAILKEEKICLFEYQEWANYSSKVSHILNSFHTWLQEGHKKGLKIYGYGAAAKASTLLNSINADSNLIAAIADISLEKQERYLPAHGIKIISPEQLVAEKPTDVVIFPWNIKIEIANYLQQKLGKGVRLWCPIPSLEEVVVKWP
jgi:hypothetical protein